MKTSALCTVQSCLCPRVTSIQIKCEVNPRYTYISFKWDFLFVFVRFYSIFCLLLMTRVTETHFNRSTKELNNHRLIYIYIYIQFDHWWWNIHSNIFIESLERKEKSNSLLSQENFIQFPRITKETTQSLYLSLMVSVHQIIGLNFNLMWMILAHNDHFFI